MKKENAEQVLVVIPTSFGADDRRIASMISGLVHKLGGSCCHTSSTTMRFDSIEERHQERISTALKNGARVFAFGASTELENMGVIQMGNIRLNAAKRLEAAIVGAAT
jgi:hypothetical protein